MSDERNRDRGNLFENADRNKKPSQPDMQGTARLNGVDYELRAWRREDQLALAVAPPRGDRNTYPPDTMRGALDPGEKPAGRAKSDEPVPAWVGDIIGDELAYQVQGFPKQGKSGVYFTLSFKAIPVPPRAPAPTFDTEEPAADDEDDDDVS